jgi:hypothetical protein
VDDGWGRKEGSYAQNLNLGIPDNIRETAEAHLDRATSA